MAEINILNSHITPTWCPGCGNWGIFQALKLAIVELKFNAWETVLVTDVGCAGNLADFINVYSFHSLHGRALPIGAGIKLANHKLKVICVIGDGGCYGEGLTHFINLMRGNHDITVLVSDNYLYSLTTGQYSPTTPKGTITKSTPEGSLEEALNPLALALVNSCTFAARGFALDIPQLTQMIKQAINHQGFSLIDILQPCITLNKYQKFEWYKNKIQSLSQPFTTLEEAIKDATRQDKLSLGIFWQTQKPSYHEQIASLKEKTLIQKPINNLEISKLVEEFI